MKFTYSVITPKQSKNHTVFGFCANAKDIFEFAEIDRIGRTKTGSLKGFQRPKVATHIREIREYLEKEDAVLPNSIVVAFTSGVKLSRKNKGTSQLTIEASEDSKPGLIVDGQQRLSALQDIEGKDFEVLVTGLICENEDELRKQFILINNTKPLSKQLIYELLPTVDGLPVRLSSRSTAAALVERLNYDESSSLHGQIHQHTNPIGKIRDTALQRIIMSSLSDGILRELFRKEGGFEQCFQLLSDYFAAVQKVFEGEWVGHNPTTSRLVHGCGLVAMGYVMEYLHATTGAKTVTQFSSGLTPLKENTAWTSGHWNFGVDNKRKWNSLQNLPRDYKELSYHLLRVLKN